MKVGDTATYTVAATSLLPLTYQWYSAPARIFHVYGNFWGDDCDIDGEWRGADGQRERI